MAGKLDKLLDVIDEIIDTVMRRTNEPDLAAAVVNLAKRTKELEARVASIESDLSDEVTTTLDDKVRGAMSAPKPPSPTPTKPSPR